MSFIYDLKHCIIIVILQLRRGTIFSYQNVQTIPNPIVQVLNGRNHGHNIGSYVSTKQHLSVGSGSYKMVGNDQYRILSLYHIPIPSQVTESMVENFS